MAKLKNNLNLFDLFSIVIIAAFVLVLFFSWNNKTYLGLGNVRVEISVTNQETIENIQSELGSSKSLYYSGTAYTVSEVSHSVTVDDSGANQLEITVEGRGEYKTRKFHVSGTADILKPKS